MMSKLKAGEAAMSITQKCKLGIAATRVILQTYSVLKTNPSATGDRLTCIREIQQLLAAVQSKKDVDKVPLESSIGSMVDKLLLLEAILRRVERVGSHKGGKFLMFIQSSMKKSKVEEILRGLEHDEITFLRLNVGFRLTIDFEPSPMPILVGMPQGKITDRENSTAIAFSNLPAMHVPGFIGRKTEISLIDTAYKGFDMSRRVYYITGAPGSGKSHLALEFCRRESNRTSTCWIQSSNKEEVDRSFGMIASEIYSQKMCKYPCRGLQNSINYVKNFLNSARLPWIIVFDNWNVSGELPNFASLLSDSDRGFVLVTSKNSDIKRLGAGLTLSNMTDDDALELWRTKLGLDIKDKQSSTNLNVWRNLGHYALERAYTSLDDDDEATQCMQELIILRRFDNLPLAIDQAASFIKTTGMSLRRFIRNYKIRGHALVDSPAKIERLLEWGWDTELRRTPGVIIAWELNFSKTKSSIAGQLVDILGFFSPSSIDETLFQGFWILHNSDAHKLDHIGHARSLLDLLKLFTGGDGHWDSTRFRTVVALLKDKGLIERFRLSRTNKTRISLHPMVSDWLKTGRSKKELHASFAQTCAIVHSMISTATVVENCTLEFRQELLSHIDNLFAQWKLRSITLDKKLYVVLIDFCSFYIREGHYSLAAKILEELEQSLDSTDLQESFLAYEALRGQARSYYLLRNFERAEVAAHKSMTGFQSCFAADTLSTALAQEILADVYKSRHKFEKAEELYLQVIQYRKATLNRLDKRVVRNLAMLAVVYLLHGRQKDALSLYEKELKQLWTDGKELNLGLLWIKIIYAILLQHMQYFEDARVVNQEILAFQEKHLGLHHLDTIKTMSNLAMNYKSQHKWDKSRESYFEAISRLKETLGESHPETLSVLNDLGDLYMQQSDLYQAELLLIWVLQRQKEVLGSEHSGTLTTIERLTNVYRLQDRPNDPETSSEVSTDDWSDKMDLKQQETKEPSHGMASAARKFMRRQVHGYRMWRARKQLDEKYGADEY